jgi:hypothetical protein
MGEREWYARASAAGESIVGVLVAILNNTLFK